MFIEKKTSHEIWEALEAIYVGSKKLREKKYQVLKENLMNSKCFQMSWLNKCMLD